MPPHEQLPLRRLGALLTLVGLVIVLIDQLLLRVAPDTVVGRGLAEMFDVSREANIATFWNASLLILLAAACTLVATLVSKGRGGWCAAAVIAFIMAADETVQLHERLDTVGASIEQRLGIDMPTFAWLIPGAVLALVGAGLVFAWSGRQPARTKNILRLALLLYGTGAIGVEALSSLAFADSGAGPAYRAAAGLEELLEMTACALAVVAVLAMFRLSEADSRRSLHVVDLSASAPAAHAATGSQVPLRG